MGTLRKKLGFTLIELLVVISIIALLLSIMMPALARVREQARGVICLTRARQLGMAAMTYINDFKDRYPDALSLDDRERAIYIETDTNKARFWEDRLLPYVNNEYDVYLCPSTMARQKSQAEQRANPRRNNRNRSYSMNAFLAGYRGTEKMEDMGGFPYMYGPSMRYSQFKHHSMVALFNDVDAWGFGIYEGGCFRTFNDCAPWHDYREVDRENNLRFQPFQIWGYTQRIGRATWIFADGHGELIQREYTIKTSVNPPIEGMRIDPLNPKNLLGQ